MTVPIFSTPWALIVGAFALAVAPIAAADDGAADATADLRPGQLVTIAGTGESGSTGDGGPAREAQLGAGLKIDVGPDGTVYIADIHNDRLRMVTEDGVIDAAPGSPVSGDEDRAAWAVAAGADGAVYIGGGTRRGSDTEPSAAIERGGPDGGFVAIADGDDLRAPLDLAAGGDGTVYLIDEGRGQVLAIDADGAVTSVAGGGRLDPAQSGEVPADEVLLYPMTSVDVDSSGNVYVVVNARADDGGPSLYRISADGMLTRLIGHNPEGFAGDGGPVEEAQVGSQLGAVAVDAEGDVFVADVHNNAVRKISSDGTITTVGSSLPAVDDLAVGPGGELYLSGDSRVMMLAPTGHSVDEDEPMNPGADPWAGEEPGTVITVAGTGEQGSTGEGGPAVEAALNSPDSIAVAADGMLYIVEQHGKRLLAVEPDGALASVVNVPDGDYPLDLVESMSAVAPGPDGTVYVAAEGLVSKMYPDGAAVLVAGGGTATQAVGSHRLATAVAIGPIAGLASAPDGTLYIVDTYGLVYELAADGTLTTVTEDSPLTDASGIAVDADGNIYAADLLQHRLRKIDDAGAGSVLAGNGAEQASSDDNGDGGPATDAVVGFPSGVAVAADGTVYVSAGSGIRKIDGDGTISTVSVEEPYAGLGALALDAHGNLYFSETEGHRVRVLVRPGELRASSSWAVVGVAAGGVVVVGTGVVLLRRRRRE